MIIWLFYLSAYIYSWSIWILGITFFKTSVNPYGLASIGGLGPIVGLLVYFKLLGSKKDRQKYIKRLFKIKNIKIIIWLIVIFLPFAVIVLSNFIDYLIAFNTLIDFHILELDREFLAAGFFYPVFLIFLILVVMLEINNNQWNLQLKNNTPANLIRE